MTDPFLPPTAPPAPPFRYPEGTTPPIPKQPLARATHRWKAEIVRKALAGVVAYELVDGVGVPFEPVTDYRAEHEPFPWTVA